MLFSKIVQKYMLSNQPLRNMLTVSLRKVLEQRDSVYEKISQYLQLKNTIQSLQVHPFNLDSISL